MQRYVIGISAILLIGMALYPPWRGVRRGHTYESGPEYAFLLAPRSNANLQFLLEYSERIDAGLLLAQCVVVVTVAALLLVFIRQVDDLRNR